MLVSHKTEPIFPGFFFVTLATFSGLVLTRSRSRFTRLWIPSCLGLGTLLWNFPTTSHSIFSSLKLNSYIGHYLSDLDTLGNSTSSFLESSESKIDQGVKSVKNYYFSKVSNMTGSLESRVREVREEVGRKPT